MSNYLPITSWRYDSSLSYSAESVRLSGLQQQLLPLLVSPLIANFD